MCHELWRGLEDAIAASLSAQTFMNVIGSMPNQLKHVEGEPRRSGSSTAYAGSSSLNPAPAFELSRDRPCMAALSRARDGPWDLCRESGAVWARPSLSHCIPLTAPDHRGRQPTGRVLGGITCSPAIQTIVVGKSAVYALPATML